MQTELRIPPTKFFFFFQTSTVLFPPFQKYHVVFQDQSKDCMEEDDIADMIEVTVF